MTLTLKAGTTEWPWSLAGWAIWYQALLVIEAQQTIGDAQHNCMLEIAGMRCIQQKALTSVQEITCARDHNLQTKPADALGLCFLGLALTISSHVHGVVVKSGHLAMEPVRPLVGNILIQEAVLGSHVGQETLHLWGHVVLDEPELDPVPAKAIEKAGS